MDDWPTHSDSMQLNREALQIEIQRVTDYDTSRAPLNNLKN